MKPYWQTKKLIDMSSDEWEALCDGCAKCCLHKLEDEDTGDVYYTDIACELLDLKHCRCLHYQERQQRVPDCLVLQPKDVTALKWLPATCAYRLVAEGKDLPEWHPLISGDGQSVHSTGISVRGRVLSATHIHPDEYEYHIVQWVD